MQHAYLEQGEMAGKLLARQIKKKKESEVQLSRTIVKIRKQDGSITVDHLQINDVFKSYYTEL